MWALAGSVLVCDKPQKTELRVSKSFASAEDL